MPRSTTAASAPRTSRYAETNDRSTRRQPPAPPGLALGAADDGEGVPEVAGGPDSDEHPVTVFRTVTPSTPEPAVNSSRRRVSLQSLMPDVYHRAA